MWFLFDRDLWSCCFCWVCKQIVAAVQCSMAVWHSSNSVSPRVVTIHGCNICVSNQLHRPTQPSHPCLSRQTSTMFQCLGMPACNLTECTECSVWQMAAYLGYTLRMRTLFRGWPIMVNDTHTRRRSVANSPCQLWKALTCETNLAVCVKLSSSWAAHVCGWLSCFSCMCTDILRMLFCFVSSFSLSCRQQSKKSSIFKKQMRVNDRSWSRHRTSWLVNSNSSLHHRRCCRRYLYCCARTWHL